MEITDNFARLYDTIRISPAALDKAVASVRDNYIHTTGDTLRVSIEATHSGRVTRNHGFYLPQKMRDGAISLLEEFGKPILLHHNENKDPIGRVVRARYIDTSGSFVQGNRQDQLVRSITDFKTPYYQQINLADELINSELASDPAYNGLGYILVEAEINDPEAIVKIADKRYLTVSIGATTDKAICSICKQNWVDEGRCDHTPGKKYEDKLCVMIAGKLAYDEVSFVNAPADVKARVVAIHNGGLIDSIMAEEAIDLREVNASFSFSLQDTVGGKEMNVKEAWEKVQALLQDSEKKEEVLVALTDFLATEFSEENPHREEAEKILNELKAPEEGNLEEADPPAQETQEDEALWKDADQHYDDMIAFGYELSLVDEKLEDAKLSSEQRKTMKKSAFCKPGERKYPVLDGSHARVALAYAKHTDEPQSVLGAIFRKASALGDSFEGDKGFAVEIEAILADYAKRANGEEELPAVQPEVVLDAATKEASCEECTALQDQLKALRGELRDIYNEAAEDQQIYIETLGNMSKVLADTTTKLEVISGTEIADMDQHTTEVASMKIQDLLSKAEEVTGSVDTEKILAKLNDGMSREPAEVIEDPSITDQAVEDPTGVEQVEEEEDKFSRIKAGFNYLLDNVGLEEADAYIKNLKRDGVIDSDFDPNS